MSRYPLPGLGHNNGPTMERGFTYRKHQWKKAREALLPTLPLMVLKMRVKRAKELGLDYKTFAGVRASTGRDVIGFLFSSNALRLQAVTLPEATASKVGAIQSAGKLALVHRPSEPKVVEAANPALDVVAAAPLFTDTWSEMRAKVHSVIQSQRLPADGVLVIGSTSLEREWSVAARAAGYLPAERYFGDVR
ncbi:MAG: hypothetical protein AAGF13_07225 [Pseudomonadota bacterium]